MSVCRIFVDDLAGRRSDGGEPTGWTVRSYGLVAPVFEELLFRGLLFGLLEPLGIPLAILVTAIVFALSHFDRRSFGGLLVSGLVFAALRAATGGLATQLIAHALANGFGFVMSLVSSRGSGRPETAEEWEYPDPAAQHSEYEQGRS